MSCLQSSQNINNSFSNIVTKKFSFIINSIKINYPLSIICSKSILFSVSVKKNSTTFPASNGFNQIEVQWIYNHQFIVTHISATQ